MAPPVRSAAAAVAVVGQPIREGEHNNSRHHNSRVGGSYSSNTTADFALASVVIGQVVGQLSHRLATILLRAEVRRDIAEISPRYIAEIHRQDR